MWEERSCKQVRQWLHWGSGCYRFRCEDGRLHIVVGNYTYTCFFPGQEITIRIKTNDWLRKGAIRCPPCRELCGERFAKLGQTCRLPDESQPPNLYPRDELICKAGDLTHGSVALLVLGGTFLAVSSYIYT